MSSCTAKMSSSSRSYDSDHRWESVATWISCAVMRTRLPDLRTLPSRMLATLSFCATVGMSTSLPLNENAEVREATRKPADLREDVEELFGEAVGEVLVLLVLADVDEREHRDRRRFRVHGSALRPERRKSLRQIRVAQLEDRFAAREVLEAVLAQRLDARERRQVVAAEIVHRFRQQRLAAVSRRQQARDAIERRAEVVAVAHFDGPRCAAPSARGASPGRASARGGARAGPRGRPPARPAAVGNAAQNASPTVLNTWPPRAPIARRSSSSWRASAARIASHGVSHSRVLPSMSVKSSVTVPVGSGDAWAAEGGVIGYRVGARDGGTTGNFHSRVDS